MTVSLFKYKLAALYIWTMFINICLDLCDPKGISSRCSVKYITCGTVVTNIKNFACFIWTRSSGDHTNRDRCFYTYSKYKRPQACTRRGYHIVFIPQHCINWCLSTFFILEF